jgi:hypothetical protein
MLPGSPPTLLLRRALAASLALVALVAGAAWAIETTIGPPRERDGAVWCDVRVADVLDPRVEESLTRGMPATLELHAELWRRRSGWFDRLESSFDVSLRLRYEVWNRTYHIERAGARPLTLGSLDSVRVVLDRPLALPIGRGDRVASGARYYAVVTATLRPLSIEDAEEVEGWLSGEVVDKRRAGFGAITELPRSAFDAVRNFAGLGDQRARARTEEIVLRPVP